MCQLPWSFGLLLALGGQGEHAADELGLAPGAGFGEDSLDVETRRFEGRAEVTGNSADLHALEQEIGDAALGGGKSVDGAHGCGAGTHRRGCVYQEDECGEGGDRKSVVEGKRERNG